jgi:hypothetical protein
MKVTPEDLASMTDDVRDLTAAMDLAQANAARYRLRAAQALANAGQADQEAMTASYGLDVTLGELAAAAEAMQADME